MERSPEIISLPPAVENSRQFLLLRTDILQKTVVACLCYYFSIFAQSEPLRRRELQNRFSQVISGN